MIFPIDWPEPFGLVMIESLAAGTPVVALNRGSVPEVLEHGVSGWICDDVGDLVRGVEAADQLSAAACRRRALDFSADRMAQRYLDVYRRLVAEAASSPRDRIAMNAPFVA
jgi:glycosyltransferase involved in cell wall biosynthesis